jgi:hypothetical protein
VYIAKKDKVSARQSLQKAIKYATNARFEQEFELKDDASRLLRSLQASS